MNDVLVQNDSKKEIILKRLRCSALSFSLVITVVLMSSCASLMDRGALFENQKKAAKPRAAVVSKTQYDQLLLKYNTLRSSLKTDDKVDLSIAKKLSVGTKDTSPIVDKLTRTTVDSSELAETVDVFARNLSKSPNRKKSVASAMLPSDFSIEEQILQVRKVITLIGGNRFDQALGILKELENSNVKQIKVRAKFLLGELLFRQGEYDLSMQIFEQIINKYSFSGLVIKTLGRLIVCSEKLKLSKKKEQYYSILHDFFEAT